MKKLYNDVCAALSNNTFNDTYPNEKQDCLNRFRDQVRSRSDKAKKDAAQKIPFMVRNITTIVPLSVIAFTAIGIVGMSYFRSAPNNVLDTTSDFGESTTKTSQTTESTRSTVSQNQSSEPIQSTDIINVGDTVYFSGTVQYVASYNGSVATKCKNGIATVTAISNGQAHPYHIVGIEVSSSIYGWVDEDDIVLR